MRVIYTSVELIISYSSVVQVLSKVLSSFDLNNSRHSIEHLWSFLEKLLMHNTCESDNFKEKKIGEELLLSLSTTTGKKISSAGMVSGDWVRTESYPEITPCCEAVQFLHTKNHVHYKHHDI